MNYMVSENDPDPMTTRTRTPNQTEPSGVITPFDDRPPQVDRVSAYDERHLVSYLRLLDAEAEGADWREAVAIIFGLDSAKEPDRARLVHDSHLLRAHWMRDQGYRQLLEPRLQ